MNHHQRHLPPGVNRALRSLLLLLLALTFRPETQAMPRIFRPKPIVPSSSPRGYLAAVGAPLLRFEEPPLLPVPSAPSAPATAENSPAVSAPAPSPEVTGAPVAPNPSEEPASREPKSEKSPGVKTKSSPQIIPDDTRPAVHPEDFLPFFQFPSAGKETGSLNVIVPVPNQPAAGTPLPPSSATYTQTPK